MNYARFFRSARWMVALSMAVFALSGCPGDEEECTTEGTQGECPLGQTCRSNKCVTVLLPDCEKDADCGEGEYCTADQTCAAGCSTKAQCERGNICLNNQCVPGVECTGIKDCAPNEVCLDGACVYPGIQCLAVEQPCDPADPAGEGWICTDFGEGNRCYKACDRRDVCSSQNLITDFVCPAGSICENDTVCRPSDCQDPARGQIQCDALAEQNPDLFAKGANCARTTKTTNNGDLNFRFRCAPAGDQQEGDSCGASSGLGMTETCARGLTCVTEIPLFGNISSTQADQNRAWCARPCTSDIQCTDGQRCIGEGTEDFGGVGVGICGEWCMPHTSDNDACADGGKCLAISSDDGLCTDILPKGEKRPYDSCSDDSVCPSGTLCVSSQCLPQCDPTHPTQDERNDTCFGGNPNAYVRVTHLAEGAADVDVYLDNVRILDNLTFGQLGEDKGEWFTVKPGTHMIHLVAADAEDNLRPILELEVELEPNTSTTFAALLKDSPIEPLQLVGIPGVRKPDTPAMSKSLVRAAHAVVGVGAVDVVATAAGGDISQTANQREVAVNLSFGAVSEYIEVDGGAYDIYIFPAGAVRIPANAAVLFQNTTVDADKTETFYAYGQTEGSSPKTPKLTRYDHKTFRFIPRLGGYCYDLARANGFRSTPAWGVCFQVCPDGSEGFGAGVCDGESLACSPFGGGLSACFGAGNAKVGEECGLISGNDVDCDDGLVCDRTGDGKGVCRSYCNLPNAPVPNPNLVGCQGSEVCVPEGSVVGLGICQEPCTPGADGFSSNACGENQKNCFTGYCSSTGDIAVGDSCHTADANPFSANPCTPGSLCVRNVGPGTLDFGLESLYYAYQTEEDDTATCRQMCNPFPSDNQSECDPGFACMPVLPTQEFSTKGGVCMPMIEAQPTSIAETDSCGINDLGKMCGDGSICTQSGNDIDRNTQLCIIENSCLSFCDPVTRVGCRADQRCTLQSDGTGSVNYFLGAFGICRDIR